MKVSMHSSEHIGLLTLYKGSAGAYRSTWTSGGKAFEDNAGLPMLTEETPQVCLFGTASMTQLALES